MPAEPRISVVIASRGRPELLAEISDWLAGQTRPPARVVFSVVEARDLPGTAALYPGARVVVTGYTDDVPLSKPTDQFKSNADIAAARAKAAVDHLAQFAKANPALAFDPQTGDPAQAPYPNDSPQNRRLNRTVTVQIIPAP